MIASRAWHPWAGGLLACLALCASGARPAWALLSLNTFAAGKDVQVTLDTGPFRDTGVATMTIVNNRDIALRGDIRACDTIFLPKDARFSPLRPAESGPFFIGPKSTVTIARLFRLVDPTKRPPDGGAYALTDDPDPEPGCKD